MKSFLSWIKIGQKKKYFKIFNLLKISWRSFLRLAVKFYSQGRSCQLRKFRQKNLNQNIFLNFLVYLKFKKTFQG